MEIAAANARWSAAFVDELARTGVRDVCVCPGSRSTPLALALARHPGIRVWMHLDERSASFFALGMAKYNRHLVGLLCTSGSAAANFMPAIVEAHYSRVPLLVMTADRPHELRDTGAPQTIDQLRLYGAHVKWFVEMALPEGSPQALRYARPSRRARLREAAAVPAGPVHLNFPFREPLCPRPPDDLEPIARTVRQPAIYRRGHRTLAPSDEAVMPVAAELQRFVRGPDRMRAQHAMKIMRRPSDRLGAHLGFPILADPLSQVRCGPHDRQMVIDSYDAFLRVEDFTRRLAPEVVLRFGTFADLQAAGALP